MHTDAELVRLHARLRKEALAVPNLRNVGAGLRALGPSLVGGSLGAFLAPPGRAAQGAAAGVVGSVLGNSAGPTGGAPNLGNGYSGAILGSAAYPVLHHLTAPDPAEEAHHGFAG